MLAAMEINVLEAMMITINKQIIVNAPIDEVWASWDKFGDIEDFNPNLKASKLLTGSPVTGIGAKRQCDLLDGKSTIYEEIIGYAPQEHMIVLMYDGDVPLKRSTIRFDFESVAANRTKLLVHAEFEMKYGLLGKLLGPMAKLQLGKAFESLLAGNAQFVEKLAA